MRGRQLHVTLCSLGSLFWVSGEEGIHWVTLVQQDEEGWNQVLRRYPGIQQEAAPHAWEEELLLAVETPLKRRRPIPLVPIGTPFQQKVWQALTAIPPGQIRSYADTAREIGRQGAMRAVGNACGANPLPFLIPCHRVVGSDGRWGGFGLGLPVKEQLLMREGVVRHRTIPLVAHARIPLLIREHDMVQLTVNGLIRGYDEAPTLSRLLDELGVLGRRVAVERNGEIVPRSFYDKTELNDGDSLEVVVAVGGG